MSNEIYTDLEKNNINDKIKYLDLKLKFDIITSLTNSYPNDQELGAKVREFVKLQEK
jgi:hypothetical protein